MKKDKNWSISYRRVLVPTSIKHQWINDKGIPVDQQTGKVEKWFWVETPEQLSLIQIAGGKSITDVDWSDVENHDTTAKEIVESSMAEEIWCHDDANQLGKQLGLNVAY
jgi:hypothetical protein